MKKKLTLIEKTRIKRLTLTTNFRKRKKMRILKKKNNIFKKI